MTAYRATHSTHSCTLRHPHLHYPRLAVPQDLLAVLMVTRWWPERRPR